MNNIKFTVYINKDKIEKANRELYQKSLENYTTKITVEENTNLVDKCICFVLFLILFIMLCRF